MRIVIATLLLAALAFALTAPAHAQAEPGEAPQDPSEGNAWPGIHVDVDAGIIELDAEVANRNPDWLELLACTPQSREYESVLVVNARPSHIHLALLALGLEPGEPLRLERRGDNWLVYPPYGPEVELTLLVQGKDGVSEVPANEWIVHQETGEPMHGNRWLFTGSSFHEWEGEQVYLADLNGTAISLVSFGDDLLCRPTTTTNDTDNQMWQPALDRVPEEGTPVTVRVSIVQDQQQIVPPEPQPIPVEPVVE